MNTDTAISYHAQHAPIGAHGSFTVGRVGAAGGMALERGSPADSAVYIGYRTASGVMHSFPFFEDAESEAERFVQSDAENRKSNRLFKAADIQRDYGWATDRFVAEGVQVMIYSPFGEIPDPAEASPEALAFASCPATLLEVTVENSSTEEWELFFAHHSSSPWIPFSGEAGLRGASSKGSWGFACSDEAAEEFIDFGVEQALERTHTTPNFLLAPIAGLAVRVPAGEGKTLRIALGYYRAGTVTFNQPTSYWYARYFDGLSEVLRYALDQSERYMALARKRDEELQASGLSEAQQFLLAHATHSYFGSTQWLDNGDPLWVVNEGEYLMINTLDLTVDMLFFELRYSPWTVRNVLEHFVRRYAYYDEVFEPEAPQTLHPGGLSFTHDMGVGNTFSPEQYSCYECGGLDRKCFSYMTCEQLTNWVLCAGVYWVHTGDDSFVEEHKEVLLACLESMLNRDHPDPEKRNGLMGFDSSRTDGGGEITTYDSLDHSLGQARNNVYLGGKCWAAYLALEKLLEHLNEAAATEAGVAAKRCADTLSNAFDEQLGFLPAVLEEDNQSAIIPAVEALVYPYKMGLHDAVSTEGPFGAYIEMLKRHLAYVLRPGVCLYEDGAWKLSSSADNSWASKICLNQFVVRHILGMRYEGEERADEAHVRWQVEGAADQACCDQFSSGKPIGSLYYPRIVTSILWLEEMEQERDEKNCDASAEGVVVA